MAKTQTEYLPAKLLDGEPVRNTALEVVEWLEPVATKCGRERMGYGAMLVVGGIAICRQSYYQTVYYATADTTDSDGCKWWNYGAPHGTHERVTIKWVAVDGIGCGAGGWGSAVAM